MSSHKKAIKQPEPHPSGDERYKALDLTMKQFKFEKDALLEVLNVAQGTFGYLSEELLIYVSRQLRVPLSKVYGVATFYHMFTFEPLGEHNCIVCTGTACHVKGSNRIVHALSEAFHIKEGETTPDGLFSLTIARCLGSCGLAPVVVLDGKVSAKETPESTMRRVKEVVSLTKEEIGA
jgi:bidirectional [NiFe] hydrogenase diaphorase subunit